MTYTDVIKKIKLTTLKNIYWIGQKVHLGFSIRCYLHVK